MSAENAWRIAMAAAAEPAYGMATDWWDRAGDYVGADIKRLSERISSLPMPPAFRAEVEAEAEELRGMLVEAEAILRQLHGALNSAFMAGMEEGEGGSARRQEKRMGEYEPVRLAARALLSRLEAKGESHE